MLKYDKEDRVSLAEAYYSALSIVKNMSIVWSYMKRNPHVYGSYQIHKFEMAWEDISTVHSELMGRFLDQEAEDFDDAETN